MTERMKIVGIGIKPDAPASKTRLERHNGRRPSRVKGVAWAQFARRHLSSRLKAAIQVAWSNATLTGAKNLKL